SLVAHLTGGQGVAGSNPVVPTSRSRRSGPVTESSVTGLSHGEEPSGCCPGPRGREVTPTRPGGKRLRGAGISPFPPSEAGPRMASGPRRHRGGPVLGAPCVPEPAEPLPPPTDHGRRTVTAWRTKTWGRLCGACV